MRRGVENMKKITVLTAMLMLLGLTGCDHIAAKDNMPKPLSFSESNEISSDTETLPATEEREIETEPESIQSTESPRQETTAASNTEISTQAAAEPSAEKPDITTEPPKDNTPQEMDNSECKSAVETTPSIAENTESPKSETQDTEFVAVQPEEKEENPVFDINYWTDFAKSYAQSVGLTLNSEAVECWDNPIAAGSNCNYTERDITACLNRYSDDEDITDVWIWAEKSGENSYEIYIGYA